MLRCINNKICDLIARHLPDLIATFEQSPKNKKAFTLVELSIVIVIIGLIVGGVTAGYALVQSAKLHSDISKFKKYKMAYSLFMEQYNAVPGDMKNATDYWGGAVSNGNGDKIITTGGEDGHVFSELALAKLIDGSYTAWQFPRPSIAKYKTDYFLIWAPTIMMWGLYRANSTNAIGVYSPSGDGAPWNTAVTPAQGLAIDTKIDDGIPTKGKVTAYSSGLNDCIYQSGSTTNADANTYVGVGSYNLAQTAQQCGISVWLHR